MIGENNLLSEALKHELTDNILPYWIRYTVDQEYGGFYGKITNENQVIKTADKAVVICARILWTFSAAYRIFQCGEYKEMADRAWGYLISHFWDHEYGGVFWNLSYKGVPIDTKKQIYAQAFAVYGLSEYYMAVKDKESLSRALELVSVIEEHGYDEQEDGYMEAFSRNWGALDDTRLLEDDQAAEKTMNTHLHLLEAYTNLYKAMDCRNSCLEKSIYKLLHLLMDRFVDADTGHFHMYFDRYWNNLSSRLSYGHDIEGSWLLLEAADALDMPELTEKVRAVSLKMADAVRADGFDDAGGLLYETEPDIHTDNDRVWWVEAEAVVGFYNAYQISGNQQYKTISLGLWDYINNYIVDHNNGEWFRRVKKDGLPRSGRLKIDEWKCPYHNSRMCFEMIQRVTMDGGNTI